MATAPNCKCHVSAEYTFIQKSDTPLWIPQFFTEVSEVKVEVKVGVKVGVKVEVKMGVKMGVKVGVKVGVKMGVKVLCLHRKMALGI